MAENDGTVLVDKAAWDAAQASIAEMKDLLKTKATERGEALVDQAIRAGKFPPSRRDHWVKLFSADPQGTEQTLASLAPGAIPLGAIGVGVSGSGEDFSAVTGDQAYPTNWLSPAEHAAKSRVAAGTGPPRIQVANEH